MTIAALTWPVATVYVALIIGVSLVLSVICWSIFRTGQTAIRSESADREGLDRLRRDVDELRARLQT
jgi:hypothetical protein